MLARSPSRQTATSLSITSPRVEQDALCAVLYFRQPYSFQSVAASETLGLGLVQTVLCQSLKASLMAALFWARSRAVEVC